MASFDDIKTGAHRPCFLGMIWSISMARSFTDTPHSSQCPALALGELAMSSDRLNVLRPEHQPRLALPAQAL